MSLTEPHLVRCTAGSAMLRCIYIHVTVRSPGKFLLHLPATVWYAMACISFTHPNQLARLSGTGCRVCARISFKGAGCSTTTGCEVLLRQHSGRWCSQQRLPGSPIGRAVCSCAGIVATVSGNRQTPLQPWATSRFYLLHLPAHVYQCSQNNRLQLAQARPHDDYHLPS